MPKIKINYGYVSPFFITDPSRRVAELTEPYILVHEKALPGGPGGYSVIGLLEMLVASRRPLLIVGEEVTPQWLNTLVLNKRNGTLKAAAVEVRGTQPELSATLDRIAEMTGGYVFNEKLGIPFENFSLDMMGTAQRAIITRETTTIIGADEKASDSVIRQGPRPATMLRVKQQILAQIAAGCITMNELRAMKQESLAARFGVGRETAQRALRAAAAEAVGVFQRENSDKYRQE
jgi:chaperonin GroEL